MKYIAVLSSNKVNTYRWLTKNLPHRNINFDRRIVVDEKEDVTYVIVEEISDGFSWEFNSYIISPNYSTLLDFIKTRIKR